VKSVVFDFGGVVFRWRPAVLLERELPQRVATAGGAAALATAFFVDGGDWNEFDRGALDAEALVERIARRLDWSTGEVRRVVDAVPAELQPVPETVALLRRIKDAGHGLYYLSNMPVPYAEYLLREHAFLGWFDDGVFSSQVLMIKPDAALFGHALQRFGIAPAEAFFFDDHAPNVETARAIGMQARLWTDAAAAEAALRSFGLVAG
jgi:HAD superfamily hydrolase (TIGR01509 family)